jgi:AcrR family transcriptional regulator
MGTDDEGPGTPVGPARPHTGRTVRPHTGRRRNDAAREAILDATFDLLHAQGAEGLTIDAIAAAAGVGRQTIYRWWPSKLAVAADAMAYYARGIAPVRDSGSFRDDLAAFVADSFAGAGEEGALRALRQLGAAAQRDEHVASVVADFTAGRRAELHRLLARGQANGALSAGADLDMLADMMFGVLWYRIMISRQPLDQEAAGRLTACLIAAGTVSDG